MAQRSLVSWKERKRVATALKLTRTEPNKQPAWASNSACKYHGCTLPGRVLVASLSQSSVRLRNRSGEQPTPGVGVSRAYLPLAQARRSFDVCHSPTSAEALREDPQRALYWSVGVQADGTRECAVQAS